MSSPYEARRGTLYQNQGARWRSGRASDSESRGPGFEPHKRHRVVSLSKAHLLPTVLVKPRKRWLRPDMTEKLLTGTLNLNTNKQTNYIKIKVIALIINVRRNKSICKRKM